MNRFALCAIATSLLAASAVAQSPADPTARAVRFGIAGGVAVPVGDFKDGGSATTLKRDLAQGVAAQGYVEARAPGTPLGFRAAVSYNRFGAGSVQFTRPGTGGTATTTTTTDLGGYSQVLGALANLTLELPTGPIRPYVIAGLGAFNLKSTGNPATTPAGVVTAGPDQTSTNFGIDGGAGVLLRLGRLEGFAEARMSNVYTKAEKFANLKSVQFVPVTFGLMF